LATASGVKIPRIAKCLRAASQVSALHAATIYGALQPVVRVINTKPVRELFADLTAECAHFDLAREQMRIRLDRAERWAKADCG